MALPPLLFGSENLTITQTKHTKESLQGRRRNTDIRTDDILWLYQIRYRLNINISIGHTGRTSQSNGRQPYPQVINLLKAERTQNVRCSGKLWNDRLHLDLLETRTNQINTLSRKHEERLIAIR